MSDLPHLPLLAFEPEQSTPAPEARGEKNYRRHRPRQDYTLSPSTIDAIARLAEFYNLSRSQIVDRAVEHFESESHAPCEKRAACTRCESVEAIGYVRHALDVLRGVERALDVKLSASESLRTALSLLADDTV